MTSEGAINREAVVRRIKALRRLSEHPSTELPLAQAAKAKAIELKERYGIPLVLLVEEHLRQSHDIPPPPPSGVTFTKTAAGYDFHFTYDYDIDAYNTFMTGMAEIRARLRAEQASTERGRIEGR